MNDKQQTRYLEALKSADIFQKDKNIAGKHIISNDFYVKRCEHLEKLRDCQDIVMGIKEKKIESLEATLKAEERYTKLLEEQNKTLGYRIKELNHQIAVLKNNFQDLVMENDTLEEKNNIEIG